MPKNSKICPYAFSRLTLGSRTFNPCCNSWFNESFFEMDHTGNSWTSEAAKELRKSMLDGNFKYCRRDICQKELVDFNEVDEHEGPETYLDKETILKLRNDEALDDIPITSVAMTIDIRCNLSCPSCRSDKITTLTPETSVSMFYSQIRFFKLLPQLRKISFAGYSEFFFVDWTKKTMRMINKKTAPKLKSIYLLTNGTLLNDQSYEALGTGKEYIDTINVSIDAGDKETYMIVRGANWERLLLNLDYIKKLRSEGKINMFNINFVIQKNNLDSIQNFIKLGESLDVDLIMFTELLDWSQNMGLAFNENAVHLKVHPLYQKYKLLKEKFENHSKVLWRID